MDGRKRLERSRIGEKREDEFAKLRREELSDYKRYLAEAAKIPDDGNIEMKGYYLRMAGESLSSDHFWSSERLCYDYAADCQDEGDGQIYYVTTDRHY